MTAKRETVENELRALSALKEVLGGNWEHQKGDFSTVDIIGSDRNGEVAVVEVKSRRQIWDTMWLSEGKVRNVLKLRDDLGADKALLINSIGHRHFVYDIAEIAKGNILEREMNFSTKSNITANRNYQKVLKKVYEFDHDSYLFELTEKKIGPRYEAK